MGAGASTLEGVDKAKLETLQTELSKPVDLSDLAEGTDAKEEVKKIRALFIESGLDKVGSDEIKAEAGKQADCADVTDDGKAELTRLRGLLAAMKAKADATTTETTTEPTTTETTGDANVVEEITVQQLLEKVDEAILTHKKWPLFLDSNDSKPVAAFLGYQQNMTIDAKKGMVESSIKKTKSIEEVQEEWRQLASKSLIAKSQPTAGFQGAGCPLWLHMGASATDFKGKYSAEGSKFPIDIFSCEKMATEESKQKFVTEEEKGPVDLWGKDFKVILTSDFELEDYKEFLENSIPLEQLSLFSVVLFIVFIY